MLTPEWVIATGILIATIAFAIKALVGTIVSQNTSLGKNFVETEVGQKRILQLTATVDVLQHQIVEMQILNNQNTVRLSIFEKDLAAKDIIIAKLQAENASLVERVSTLENLLAARDKEILGLKNELPK